MSCREGGLLSLIDAHLCPLWLQRRTTINTVNSVEMGLGTGQEILKNLKIRSVFKDNNGQISAKENNYIMITP